MPIDSASKRASAAGFSTLEEFIIPDGTLDQGDRQTIGNCYSGILAEAVTLLVTCFLNVKADMQNQMNILSAVAGAANILGTIQDNVNISVTLKTDVNIRGEVC